MKEKKNNYHYTVARGRVFFLGSLEESDLVLVVSNETHNQYSDHLVVVLMTDKNVDQVRSSLEIYCEVEKRKLKILTSHLYTISKENFYKLESYLGKLDDEIMRKVSDKIRLILNLEN